MKLDIYINPSTQENTLSQEWLNQHKNHSLIFDNKAQIIYVNGNSYSFKTLSMEDYNVLYNFISNTNNSISDINNTLGQISNVNIELSNNETKNISNLLNKLNTLLANHNHSEYITSLAHSHDLAHSHSVYATTSQLAHEHDLAHAHTEYAGSGHSHSVYEVKSNKITAWNTTSSDTSYPSEKLVKTTLDGKASTSHSHDLSHSHSQYATTGHSHSLAHAHSEYLTSLAHEHNLAHSHSAYATTGQLAHSHDLAHAHTEYAGSGHSHSAYEAKSNKITAWNTTSSDTSYPSEKLVKNALDSKASTSHSHDLSHSHSAYATTGQLAHSHDLAHAHTEYAGSGHSHSAYEAKSNKITSWNTTSSDTSYPSEKLVKTALDGKASTSHSHDLSHSHSQYATTGHSHSLAHAHSEYLTSLAHSHDLAHAHTEYLTSLAHSHDLAHSHSVYATTGQLAHSHDLAHTHTEYAGSGHSHSAYEAKSNKITAWNTTSSDTSYPSEKLVKTALDSKASTSHSHDLSHSHSQYANTSHSHSLAHAHSEYLTSLAHSHSTYITSLAHSHDFSHSHTAYITSLAHGHTEFATTSHSHNAYLTSLAHSHTAYITSLAHSHDFSHSHSQYLPLSGGKMTNKFISVGNSSGTTEIKPELNAIIIGPSTTRGTTSNSYYPGIAFNHMINYNSGTGYDNSSQAWIGLRLHSTPGSELSYLVFATKPGTGTTETGNDIPIERMSIAPDGSVAINNSLTIGGYTAITTNTIGHSHSAYLTSLAHSHSAYLTSLAHGHTEYATTGHSHSAYLTSLAHSHTDYVPKVSSNRPGVTKLYRKDSDDAYNVQTDWTGTYWRLQGYYGDTYHAGCQVAYANNSGWANGTTYSNLLYYQDTRDTAVSVSDAVGYNGIKIEFKNKASSGIPSTGTWTCLITLDGYSDSSGGYPSQLGFSMSDTGETRHLYMRSPKNSSEWGAWQTLAFIGDLSHSHSTYLTSLAHSHSEYSSTSHTHSFASTSHTHDYLYCIQTSSAQTTVDWAKTTANSTRKGFIYNTNGVEWSYLFGLSTSGTNATYGAILKMGYNDKYLRILRVISGTWQSSDWEKISAGYADSAGSIAWDNITSKPSTYTPSDHSHSGYLTSLAHSHSFASTSHTHDKVVGSYTSNGGQQNPNYFGTNRVGFLMMNTTVNSNSQYKDWLIMDCYSGNDVGGGVAIGVNRQSLGAYIMRSAAARTSWEEKAELIGTHNYTSYCATTSHSHSGYATTGHSHSGYLTSLPDHSHSGYLTSLTHAHTDYITSLSHSHSGYATTSHSHSGYLTSLAHSHSEYLTSLSHSHTFTDINPGVATIGDGANRIMFRTNSSWASGMYYHTTGAEAMVFMNRGLNVNGSNNGYSTSWIFAYGTPSDRPDWTGLTPAVQIKESSLIVNKLVGGSTTPAYNLDVNGSANATTLYENGVRVSLNNHTHSFASTSHSHSYASVSASGDSSTTYYLMGTPSTIGTTLYRYGTSGPYMKSNDVYCGSDINLKKDITPISDEFIEELFKKDDITYNFKWKDNDKESVGFIAQDIEDIMPEVVDEDNDIKHVNYDGALSKVVGALFKEIKSLKNIINNQQIEIENLKLQINN